MNLIDKDKIVSDLQKVLGITDEQIEKGGINADIIDSANPLIGGFLQYILNLPTVDAVEVVRCKECKFNKGTKVWLDGDVTIDCDNGMGYPPHDWFCADGERRDPCS